MNPAFSVVLFTSISGAAQGLVVALACATLFGLPMSSAFMVRCLLVAAAMLVVGLGASFLHLGRPERAWRAALMWRTSWLSREVIVLPLFIAVVSLWCAALALGWAPRTSWALALVALVVAAVLWYCTAMIYACLRFIEEWASPWTMVNFVLLGLSSGWLLASALAVVGRESGLAGLAGPAALAATLAAWACRVTALRRNARLRHRSTLQSATGIRSTNLVQKSMGMSAGSFNTREFFHHASSAALKHVKLLDHGLAFAAPLVLMTLGLASGSAWPWVLAVCLQAAGVVADRWLFFAQAKHPQNLYYQVVS